jgi:LDH2 family malate/lactate/ureidoglycolate dehydrogenase
MSNRLISADALRSFVQQVFIRAGYPSDQAVDATDVLLWASLRGVDTHGVRNLKSYYIDRTKQGQLRPSARVAIKQSQRPNLAIINGDSGLGLACACGAMRLAIEMARQHGIGMVCARNTHHLGPAGYYAHLAVEHGMLGICMTGHFFGEGNPIGIAPPNSLSAMFSTSPLSFAAPCGRHAPFVLDMATSVATVNRIEMYAQEALPLPEGWACDMFGVPTTDASAAALLLPLGGSAILGAYKGAGLAMMVSILSCVLSGAWARVGASAVNHGSDGVDGPTYQQSTMGHFFAAIQVDAFQPLEEFQAAIDAMIDALHATPTSDPRQRLQYSGEVEAATAKERAIRGIPVSERLFDELQQLAEILELEAPQ